MNRKLTQRLIRYAQVWTTSDDNSNTVPSTQRQFTLAKMLQKELIKIGMTNVVLDDKCYLYATLPGNIDDPEHKLPVLGFIAHMDTAPEASGKDVKPRVVTNYDGKDIVLNEEKGIVMKTDMFPELLDHIGEDLIVTDGTTLLGADDKAGIAEIMTAMEYLIKHPEVKHGEIRVAFNPDEEIGCGAHNFDLERFACDWAYTMDGGERGELEFENFNAAAAKITVTGRSVHPGTAKDKMVNAMTLATKFHSAMPAKETPEHTEGYQGFFHLIGIEGNVGQCQMTYFIRDHYRERFEKRKERIQALVDKMNEKYDGAFSLELRDQYYNMKEKVQEADAQNSSRNWPGIIDLAKKAMRNAGVKPKVQPIRGGTDGAQLSFKGLPCPNIFAGGMNMHGNYEYCPVQSMVAATQTIINIVKVKS